MMSARNNSQLRNQLSVSSSGVGEKWERPRTLVQTIEQFRHRCPIKEAQFRCWFSPYLAVSGELIYANMQRANIIMQLKAKREHYKLRGIQSAALTLSAKLFYIPTPRQRRHEKTNSSEFLCVRITRRDSLQV